MTRRVVLVRHGETEWSAVGRHTGLTDIALTGRGEAEAALVRDTLDTWSFSRVYSSPLIRAEHTASIAGFDPVLDPNLVEWDYGDFEGLTNDEIVSSRPGWSKWVGPVDGGEEVGDVGVRADQFIGELGPGDDVDVLVFAHGHFLSVMIARWLRLDADDGRLFPLKTATASVLSKKRTDRVLELLNHRCGDRLES